LNCFNTNLFEAQGWRGMRGNGWDSREESHERIDK
jgi:hypothetical protein